MDATEVQDELELLRAMHGDALTIVPSGARLEATLRFDPTGYAVTVSTPAAGYCPAPAAPGAGGARHHRVSATVPEGPNVVCAGDLERHLARFLLEQDPDTPSLLVVALQAAADYITLEQDAEAEAAALRDEAAIAAELAATSAAADEESVIDSQFRRLRIVQGVPIADRKSKFVAYVAPVASEAQVQDVVQSLRAMKHIACACHPTIYAYRFADATGLLHYDCDDDGEKAASKKMLFLMEQLNVVGWVVIVTRYFGGILLGPDRFKHIATVTRDTLIAAGATRNQR